MSGPENNVPRDDLREQAIARARKMLDNDASDPEIVAATGITRAELDGAAPKPYIDPVTIHRTRYEQQAPPAAQQQEILGKDKEI